MVLLKITYRLRAHHMPEFERIFEEQIVPLAQEYKLHLQGLWRTLIGEVGEYLELWEFTSLTEFEEEWRRFFADARLQEIFKTTGPMVEGEKFALLEPVGKNLAQL